MEPKYPSSSASSVSGSFAQAVRGDSGLDSAAAGAMTDAARMAIVATHTANPVVVTDASGHVEWINPAFTQLLGYTLEEVRGRRPRDLLGHADFDPVLAAELSAKADRGEGFHAECQAKDRAGTPLWVEVDVRPVRDASGQLTHAVGIYTDITRRKKAEQERARAEEALRRSEERYRQLVENAHDGVLIHAEGNIEFANPAAERMFRAPPGGLVGRSILDFVPADLHESMRARMQRVYVDRQVAPYEEITAIRVDGTPIAVESCCCPISLDGRPAAEIVIRDLTERRATEERCQRLFEQSPMPMWVFSEQDYRFLAVNDAAVQRYGYSREEFLRMTIFDIRPPDDSARLRATLTGGTGDSRRLGIWPHVTKAGEIIHVDVASHRIDFENQTARLVVAMDVTDRQRAQEEVVAWRHRYEAAVWSSGQVLYDWDMEAHTVVWGGDTKSILGYTVEELNATPDWMDRVHPEDVGPLQAELERTKKEATPFIIEYRLRRPDGTYMHVSVRGQYLTDAAGRPVRMVGFIADISDRYRAEAMQRRLEHDREALLARLRVQIERMPIGCLLLDKDMNFLDINPAGEAIFGYRRDEVVGRSAIDLIIAPSARPYLSTLLVRLAAGDMKASGHHENITKDGRVVVCDWTNTPLTDDAGHFVGVLSMVRDVTERQHLEEQLRHSQKLEAVGQLASGVAHDFNNLLTAIFGYLSLARGTIEEDHPAVKALSQLEEAARQAAGVTGGLLTFSRKAAADKSPVKLSRVVNDASRLLRRTMPAAIRLVVDTESSPEATILGDATQLQQVIVNLAINARDAMPDGGELRIALTAPAPLSALPLSAAGDWVQLTVADTGTGMTPDVRARIFEPFFTTKPPGHGAGLGLSILQGIVQEHGGHIDVETSPGAGATFSIVFPAIAVAPPGARGQVDSPAGRGELILVGEDHQLVREIIVSALRSVGYEVVAVGDGPAVLQSMSQLKERVRMLVLDIDLPGMNGIDCLQELRRSGLRRPTVVITGRTGGLDDVGLDETTVLLCKPFQVGQLLELVGNVIAGARGGTS